MKNYNYLLFILLVSLLQLCSKKNENVSAANTSNTKIDTANYERGFVNEGEVLDVNFDPTLIGAFSTQTDKKLELDSIGYFFNEFKEFAPYKNEINQFYKNRDSAYAWFDKDGLSEQADHLAVRLMNLEKDGKKIDLPYHNRFHKMMDNEIAKEDEEKIELMLTSQYIAYSKRTFEGKANELAKNADWMKPVEKFDALEMMNIAAQNGGKIYKDEPIHRHFVALKEKILDFHKNGLDTVTSQFPAGTYKMGDSSAVIAKIKERLFLLGDLKNNNKNGEFDKELLSAVHHFQYRHSLDSSNVIGKSFLESLNTPGRDRLERMLVNLERMRWVSPEDDEYLMVNIPAFKLFAYNSQDYLWDMDVIVGSSKRRTIVFSDKMAYVDFSPYWNIPPGILKRKVLPAMKRSSSYLARNGMEKVGKLTKELPLVRQKPGPKNPLGKAKFMFPNTYNIYLHDTNEKYLFKSKNKAQSSGCVRVSDPLKLAKFVLKDNKDITDSLIVEKMKKGKENRVVLAKKMPVHLTYFTTWVDHNGNLIFSNDIYKRDRKLKSMLMKNIVKPAEKSPAKEEKPREAKV